MSYFRVDRASGNLFIDLAKHELLREDILSEIVRLLEARYYFSERVYYHHAKVAAGALVARAVELALLAGTAVEERLPRDRPTRRCSTCSSAPASGPASPPGSACTRWSQRFRERRLPKRACVFPRHENAAVQEQLVARYFAPAAPTPSARASRSASPTWCASRPGATST